MPGLAALVLNRKCPHLARLESESIHVLREAVAGARQPVMLFSAGKDSTVLAHLALRAFHPGAAPFPLLHVDSAWEFQSLVEFRDGFTRRHRSRLIAGSAGRAAVAEETLRASHSERQGRFGDVEDGGSLQKKKRDGYF